MGVPARAAGSQGGLPPPNVSPLANSLEELYAIIRAFEADFAQARATHGPASGEPVIGLSVNTSKPLDLSGIQLAERITVRGTGALGRNDFFPTSETQVGNWNLQGARNIRVMGLQFNAQTKAGVGNFIGARDCVISHNVCNMAAARTKADLARPNSVGNGIYYMNSVGCSFTHNAVVGANFQLINGTQRATPGSSTLDLTIAWNVFDQVRGDHIRLQGGTNDNWHIVKNLFGGRYRTPGGDHSDCLQVGAGQATTFNNSLMELNCCFVRESYGQDNHAPVQMWWFGKGAGSADGHTFRQNGHFAPGRLINNSVPRPGVTLAKSSATYNTDMAPSDIPSHYRGKYNADFACYVYSGLSDYNLVSRKTKRSDRGAGTNGIAIDCPSSGDSDNTPSYGWAPQTAYLSCELRRTVTIGCVRPGAPGVRSHWDNARPVGAWQLMQDMFDATRAQHWKTQGWPIDAMTHIAYDPFNELAQADGTYTKYDPITGANLG